MANGFLCLSLCLFVVNVHGMRFFPQSNSVIAKHSSPIAIYGNSGIPNGQLQTNLNDYNSCLNGCQTTSDCLAIDFEVNGGWCFFHDSSSACGQVQTNPGVTHARIVADCATGMHIFGGHKQTQITSQSDCAFQCKQNDACLGFDWNSGPSSDSNSGCWFHYADTICNARTAKPTCTQYRFITCSDSAPAATPTATPTVTPTATPIPTTSGCFLTWRNQHVLGATQVLTGVTEKGCLDYCTGRTTCAAVDYDKRDSSCWEHTTSTACGTLVSKGDCLHHRKASVNCPGGGGGGGTVGNVKATHSGMHVIGGVQQTTINNAAQCVAQCRVSTTPCLAVDFDTQTGCWFHFMSSYDICTATLVAKPSCTHYKLWSCHLNQHIFGGTPMSTYTSRDACLSACYSSPTCRGIDWNRQDPLCWFHFQNTICNTIVSKTACDHYNGGNCGNNNGAGGNGGNGANPNPDYKTYTNRRILGATPITVSPSNYCQCLDTCDNNANCRGFDFDENGSTCWHFFDSNNVICNTPTSKATCTHNRKMSTNCP